MDKAKFRNQKAKPFSEKKMLEILLKAWPYPNCDGDDDDYDDEPVKKHRKKVDEPDDDQSDYDDSWDDDEKPDYSEMSPIELFKLCKERNIDAMKRKPQKYYVNILEEDDKANDDWGSDDDDDDDEWEDE